MKNALILVLTSLIACTSSAQVKSKALQKVLETYSKATSLQAQIKKVDEKIILGTKSESKGALKYQNKKLYIQLEGERKNEFYFNGQTLTLVEYPDMDFSPNGPRKVTTLKKSVPPFVKSLLNLFARPKDFNREFKVTAEEKAGEISVISLSASQKKFKSFQIKINTKQNRITEIVFVDDVDTKTTVELTETELNKKLKKSDLLFTKLKSDEEITE